MTNEELAVLVQAGQADVLALWKQVRRFAIQRARRMERAVGVRGGVTVEDLTQEGFLALLDALERWKPECEHTFITYFGTSLKKAFWECCGMRSEKQNRDPLRDCISLDQPANPDDPDSGTLGDLQPDPAAMVDIDLRVTMEWAISQLPVAHQAVIREKFWYGRQPADTKLLQAALKNLRHPSISRTLRTI